MALRAAPFLQDYTEKELAMFDKALKGAATGKGRRLTPEEVNKVRAKVRTRIAGNRAADIQLAKFHQEMLKTPSFTWQNTKYRRDK